MYVLYDFSLDEVSKTDQRTEKDNSFFKMRFSTVVCTGLKKSGKTSFCNLLMDKTVPSTLPENSRTIFIKRNTLPKDTKWIEINLKELDDLIDKLKIHKQSPKESGLPNSDETWDMLLLFDTSVPPQALCLLQRSLVTFVTYKMLGKDFEENNPEKIVSQEYSRFVKEFLSSICIGNNSYTAFVGIHNGTSSGELYAEEAKVVNENLYTLNEHMYCTDTEFPLSIWYVEDNNQNQYLHLVNLTNHKDEHFEEVKDKLESKVDNNSTHQVPLSWMLLKFRIQKLCSENKTHFMEYGVVLEKVWNTECHSSDETELNCALKFFHNLGVLFYYPTVEGINNFIFTDCHWIFESLEYLYNPDDSTHRCDLSAKLALKYEGILKSSMIEEIKFDHLGKVKFQHFINLLKHLKFIAPVNQNYFIPSILDSYEDHKEVFERYGTIQFNPLLITFSSGSLHRNVFCFLAAHILNNLPSGWSKLKYHKSKKDQHTFKDLITFCVNFNNYVCYVYILDKTFFLEIQIYSKSKGNCPADLHHTVHTIVTNSLKSVCDCLQLPYNDCKLGFLCRSCESELEQHLMVITTKTVNSSITVCCSKTGHFEVLEEKCYTIWFYEVCYTYIRVL